MGIRKRPVVHRAPVARIWQTKAQSMNAQQITIIDPMSTDEARALVMRINSHGAEIGRMLLELKEREGWRSLGYETWTDCLYHEFSFTRKHLYELMRAAPVQEQLSPMGYTVSVDAAKALSEFPEHMRPVIAQAADVRGGITEGRVKRLGAAIEAALTTGYTDTGSGESIALDAALDLEEQEAHKRRKQYMADSNLASGKPTYAELLAALECAEYTINRLVSGIAVEIDEGLSVLRQVRAVIGRAGGKLS